MIGINDEQARRFQYPHPREGVTLLEKVRKPISIGPWRSGNIDSQGIAEVSLKLSQFRLHMASLTTKPQDNIHNVIVHLQCYRQREERTWAHRHVQIYGRFHRGSRSIKSAIAIDWEIVTTGRREGAGNRPIHFDLVSQFVKRNPSQQADLHEEQLDND